MVLPELPFTGCGFESRSGLLSMAEDPGHSGNVDALTEVCARKDMHIVTGFAEKCGEKCFNSALLIGSGGMVSKYRKLHLFRREKTCFDPGDLPPAAVRVRDSVIGMMVCFDRAFLRDGQDPGPGRCGGAVPSVQPGAGPLPGRYGHQVPGEQGVRYHRQQDRN
ncbi:MAG: hypothetical protein AVO35_06065 [Candidatus Aegiribacteria sp. MLS_C]|nr:MAG: hypothetical protein AVO35_06065 [Candidatus Aegiribacteria sp. MLS_C]